MESEKYYESLVGKEIQYRDKETNKVFKGKVICVFKEALYGVIYRGIGNKFISYNQVIGVTNET